MITARYALAGAGTQTAALAFGGTPPNSGLTEQWDGISWVTAPTMATARYHISGCGTQTLALGFGGYIPPNSAATEEFIGETIATNTKTITTS
jgi:hypothetical protein